MKKKSLILIGIILGLLISLVILFLYKSSESTVTLNKNSEEGITKYAEDYVEVLIKTSDNVPSKTDVSLWTTSIQEEFERASFRQGYIVDVRPEGWNWGTLERDGKRFVIVKIPKRLWNDSWLEPELDYTKPIYEETPEVKDSKPIISDYEIKSIRKYMVDISNILTEEEINELEKVSSDYSKTGINTNTINIDEKLVENFDELVYEISEEEKSDTTNLLVTHGSAGDFTMCQAGSPTCDYSTIAGFESGEQADLTSSGNATLTISGTWTVNDTTTVIIDGWTCDAGHHIIIKTTGDARHNGMWDETAYRLVPSATRGIATKEPYTVLDGLQIWAPDNEGIYFLEGSNSTASNNLIRGGSTTYGIEIALVDTTGYFYVFNNMIYIHGARGILVDDSSVTAIIYNNLVHTSTSVGIYASSGVTIAKNNIVENTDSYDYYGAGFSGSDYNIAEDGTNTGGAHDKTGTCIFVNEAGGNFHLNSTDVNCQNNGTDLSADSYLAFSTDIDGETRSGTWDIGPDEIVSGEPPGDCWIVTSGKIVVPPNCKYYTNSGVAYS